MAMYPPGMLDLSNMWSILNMPAPTAVPASALELSGPISSWPLRVQYNGTPYAFAKLVTGTGALYINQVSHYILVVA